MECPINYLQFGVLKYRNTTEGRYPQTQVLSKKTFYIMKLFIMWGMREGFVFLTWTTSSVEFCNSLWSLDWIRKY